MGRTGLVLGAGGVGGQAFHLALLAALEDVRGWRGDDADLVVGTSVGSLVGFLIRAGVSTEELIREAAGRDLGAPDDVLTEVGHAPDPPDARLRPGPPHVPLREVSAHLRREPRLPARVALGCLLPRGECEVDAHAAWVDEVTGGRWSTRPLWICAMDLASLQRVVWHRREPGRPSIGTAVAASCAVPGLVRPVSHDGREYVDGGVYSPSNADVLVGHDLDTVLVSSPMSVDGAPGSLRPDRWWREVHARDLRRQVTALRREGVRVHVFEPRAPELTTLWEATLDGGSGTQQAIDRLRDSLGARLSGRAAAG